mgnify:CR=1 FL=1
MWQRRKRARQPEQEQEQEQEQERDSKDAGLDAGLDDADSDACLCVTMTPMTVPRHRPAADEEAVVFDLCTPPGSPPVT